jgi:hypothetical protein
MIKSMRYPDRRGEGRKVRMPAPPQSRGPKTERDPVILCTSVTASAPKPARGRQHMVLLEGRGE